MDYLTRYYKNLSEQLQDRVNYLNVLLEQEKVGETTARRHLEGIYGQKNAQEIIQSISQREQKADKKVSDSMRQNFAVPEYSKTTLDRPIEVNLTSFDNPNQRGEATPMNVGFLGLGKGTDKPAQVRLSQNHLDSGVARHLINNPSDVIKSNMSNQTLLGHEITHTLQTHFVDDQKSFPLKSVVDTPEDIERKNYTQDAYEPAARMSELKQRYFTQTGKLLKADMDDKAKQDFTNWFNQSSLKDDSHMRDTMDVFATPEGEELFRRTAKANKTSRSAENQTGIA